MENNVVDINKARDLHEQAEAAAQLDGVTEQSDRMKIVTVILDIISLVERSTGEDLRGERARALTYLTGADKSVDVKGLLENMKTRLSSASEFMGGVEGLDLLQLKSPVSIVQAVLNRYPEMRWLTGDVQNTPEASYDAQDGKTIAEHIFRGVEKAKLIEFNRTAVGILTLVWVLRDDYEAFTACQKGEGKMSRESFDRLRKYTLSVLPTADDLNAMIVYTVINDLGKIQEFIDSVRKRRMNDLALETVSAGRSIKALVAYAAREDLALINDIAEELNETLGADSVDHDVLLVEGLANQPDQSPSYQNLRGNDREKLLSGLQAKFNIGQFAQGENVPASLLGLRGIDQKGLDFYLIHAFYDIAGAAGQFVQNGSAVMRESTYKGFEIAIGAIQQLLKGKSPEEAYNHFLREKVGDSFDLDVDIPKDRALARLACILRLETSEQFNEMAEAYNNLHINVQGILESELNVAGTDDGYANLIYYSPALLANIVKNYGGPKAEAYELGFSTLARVYQEARISIKKRPGNGVHTVMAKSLADFVAKPDGVSKLSSVNIGIAAVGDDAEVVISEPASIDVEAFDRIQNLSEIPGNKVMVVGIGGGSDVIQASVLGKLLQSSGKELCCAVSVRTNKTASESVTGDIGEDRSVENPEEVLVKEKVIKIGPESSGSGRFLENIPAKGGVETYLVIDHLDGSLEADLQMLANKIGADTVIAVDTGGDALYSMEIDDNAKATPDQDLRVLKAINALTGFDSKLSCEIAVGVDSPEDAQDVLHRAGAKYFEPSDDVTGQIAATYHDWEMDGSRANDGLYGKTPFAWQLALAGQRGVQFIDLPVSNVLSKRNPWRAFVNIQNATAGMFFMRTSKHLEAISK